MIIGYVTPIDAIYVKPETVTFTAEGADENTDTSKSAGKCGKRIGSVKESLFLNSVISISSKPLCTNSKRLRKSRHASTDNRGGMLDSSR